jgi:hypothetical protein
MMRTELIFPDQGNLPADQVAFHAPGVVEKPRAKTH